MVTKRKMMDTQYYIEQCNLTRPLRKVPIMETTIIKMKVIVNLAAFIMILLSMIISVTAVEKATIPTTTTTFIRIDNDNNDRKSMVFKNYTYIENVTLPKRYDGTQLWRIYDVTEKHDKMSKQTLANIMESNYGGNIWKSNFQQLDVSIDEGQLIPAEHYLQQYNLKHEIIHKNIQNLIDNELNVVKNLTESRIRRSAKMVASTDLQWDNYYGVDTIYNFMRTMRVKYPEICRLYTIGKTIEGRNLKVLRISENPRDNKKIWIDGGIHAREWVSPSTVTFILNELLTHWNSLPEYMRNKTWYIMPIVNPDGYEYSRTTNRLWRKNRSPSKNPNCFGVDLNRNFDIGWYGKGASDNPCSDVYRGTRPGSELETDAVVKFLSKRKYNLESYLTFHSYGQLIVYPWAYKASKVKDANDLHKIAEQAAQLIKSKTGEAYRVAATHEVLGIAGGGSDDWARSALSIKFVYTIELRDRGYFGFNLPPDKILSTAVEGYIIIETVAKGISYLQ